LPARGICQRPSGTIGWRGTVVTAQYATSKLKAGGNEFDHLEMLFFKFPPRRSPPSDSGDSVHHTTPGVLLPIGQIHPRLRRRTLAPSPEAA
jgi:hypothetical protein